MLVNFKPQKQMQKGTRQMSAYLALEVPYESGTVRDSSPSRSSQKGC
jgi:hypothetical protein